MAKLTESVLTALATQKSFDRGQDYYHDEQVQSIVRKNNGYQARVWGSHRYQVEITYEDGQFHFDCDCPYDYGGICKHCVAVGLKIIYGDTENDFSDFSQYDEIDDGETNISVDNLLAKATPQQQADFLRILLNQQDKFRRQFAAFLTPATPEATKQKKPSQKEKVNIADEIEEISKEVYRTFSQMDFTDLHSEGYGHYHDDYYYDEGIYEVAEEKLMDAFDHYAKRIKAYFQSGDTELAVINLLGVYEGQAKVKEPGEDEYCLMEDYPDQLERAFGKMLKDILNALQSVVLSPERVQKLFDLLFERIHHYRDLPESEEGELLPDYSLKQFEHLLIHLIVGKPLADYMEALLVREQIYDTDAAYIWLTVKEQAGDEAGWMAFAEQFAPEERDIARMLLQKYEQLEEKAQFLKLAKISFTKWPDAVDEYLLITLSKVENRKFYADILAHFIRRVQSLERYRELREMLSEAERMTFIKSVKYELPFQVKLLQIEEKYEEILAIVRKNLMSWEFSQLIQPILNVYPNECYEIITTKTTDTLKEGRGRSLYRQVSHWLLQLQKIEAYKQKSREFINQIYNRKPTLPALRDEMKQAGVL